MRSAIALVLLGAVGTVPAHAQRLSVDAGILVGNFPSSAVYELHGDSPPFWKSRASFTISWTTDIAKPAVITEVERSLVDVKAIGNGLGGGLLWLDDNYYRPIPSSSARPSRRCRSRGPVWWRSRRHSRSSNSTGLSWSP